MRVFYKFKVGIILISIFSESFAQEYRNSLQLQLGVSHLARQDLIFSPFVHKDISPLYAFISYKRESKCFQNANLRFALYSPSYKSSYTFFDDNEIKKANPHFFTFVDFDYWIGKSFIHTKKRSTKIGISVNADIQALNYFYGRTSSFGYFSSFGLGGCINETYNFNQKSSISGYLSLPFISWLSRSPYLVNDDEFIENISSHSGLKTFFAFIRDGKPATFNQLQNFDIGVNYTYKLNRRWDLGIGYLSEFVHSSKPRNLLSYRNSILFCTNLKF